MILVLKRFRQPFLVAYILAGLVLGASVSGVFGGAMAIEDLGQIGLLLLMFFLGIELAKAGLPPSLGSFAAGVYLGRTRGFHWLGNTRHGSCPPSIHRMGQYPMAGNRKR